MDTSIGNRVHKNKISTLRFSYKYIVCIQTIFTIYSDSTPYNIYVDGYIPEHILYKLGFFFLPPGFVASAKCTISSVVYVRIPLLRQRDPPRLYTHTSVSNAYFTLFSNSSGIIFLKKHSIRHRGLFYTRTVRGGGGGGGAIDAHLHFEIEIPRPRCGCWITLLGLLTGREHAKTRTHAQNKRMRKR